MISSNRLMLAMGENYLIFKGPNVLMSAGNLLLPVGLNSD